jgi:hypothetical protein
MEIMPSVPQAIARFLQKNIIRYFVDKTRWCGDVKTLSLTENSYFLFVSELNQSLKTHQIILERFRNSAGRKKTVALTINSDLPSTYATITMKL